MTTAAPRIETRSRGGPASVGVALDVSRLGHADLMGQYLVGSRWQSISGPLQLDGLRLHQATLFDLHCPGASLVGVELDHAQISGCDFAGADLTGVSLNSATLTDVNLRGARLENVRWHGATLTRVNLAGASLVVEHGRAKLADCNLHEARLSSDDGVDLPDSVQEVYGRIAFAFRAAPVPAAVFHAALRRLWLDAAIGGQNLFDRPPVETARAAIALASRLAQGTPQADEEIPF